MRYCLNKTSVKKSIIGVFVLAMAIIIIGQAYFAYALPVLNVLYNPAKQEENESGTVIKHGDDILDFEDDYFSTPTPGPTGESGEENPEATPEATEDPNSEQGTGVISEAKKVRVSEVNFKEGTRNVLLLGMQDVLTDTIIILNIDEETKNARMISIPRDTYVPYSKSTQEAMKNCRYYYTAGAFKINASVYVGNCIVKYVGGKFNNSGIDFLCAIISQMFGCEIDDYIYVDFDGFMDIIDAIGGVTITCPEDIYAVDNNGNTSLAIQEGVVKLNAREALFYVRHRTRLDADGNNTWTGDDYYRKTNQLNFLLEIAPQIFTKENLAYSKVTEMMNVLKDSVHHSITLTELNDYINIALDYNKGKYSIQAYVIVGSNWDPLGDGISYVKLD